MTLRIVGVLRACALLALASSPCWYPRGRIIASVKIVVPLSLGDRRYVRAIAQELEKSLHQPFVVENRPGAGTTIRRVRRPIGARWDYTLLMAGSTQAARERERLYAQSHTPSEHPCRSRR